MSDILELTAGQPAHGGYCVARQEDGPVVFVRHTVPGERIRAVITAKRSRIWYADAIEILQPHPDRVPHVWPLAGPGGVGGAELGHLKIAAQRRWKQAIIEEALQHHAQFDDPVVVEQPGSDDDGLGMRTRTRLVAGSDGKLGMYKFRSKDVLPVDSLPLADQQINDLGLFNRSWKPGQEILALSTAEGALAVEAGKRRRVIYQVPTSWGDLRYEASAHGFWQAHRHAPSVLIEAVMAAAQLTPGQQVWDLYSGAGLFTVPAAISVGESGRVHSVESDPGGARAAKRNVHHLPQVHLYSGKVEKTIQDLAAADVVITDPPRSGMGAATTRKLLASGPKRLVYVACDPIALARDLGVARDEGWNIEQVRAFDLFPHTHHMEAVAVLTPRRS